jgi:hypothetical protein
MRARDLDLPPGVGAEYGIRHGVVGIGPGSGEKAARMLHRFATLPDGVLVWTRDSAGGYHLGQIRGPVSEDQSGDARAVGLAYVRPAVWLPRALTLDAVPHGVTATFARGGRNFQRIHDQETERVTVTLWRAG